MTTDATWRPQGIQGVSGVEPIGAALTIGIKPEGGRGFPVEKDRFHLLVPHEGPDGKRAPHPAFAWFNAAAPEKRRMVRATIAHASWGACLQQGYTCYRGPGLATPTSKVPACIGDGVHARRFIGEKNDDDFRQIRCPGEACQYRQKSESQQAPCKTATRLLFRLSFPDEVMQRYTPPTPVVKFTSGGIFTYRAILGLKESLDAAAKELGLATYSPLGFTFSLTLIERKSTRGGQAQRFPTLVASPDVSAFDFLLGATQRRQQLAAAVAALTDDTLGEDLRLIEGPRGAP